MGIQGCSMPDIMRISFLLCVLLLFSAPSLAEESDGAAMIAIQLAGFVTTHDVAEHSFIDKDIKDMSTEMAKKTQTGYDAALKIYQEGKNSRMQTKARTLDEFWPGMHVNTQGHKATEEPFLKMYEIRETHETCFGAQGGRCCYAGYGQCPEAGNRLCNRQKRQDLAVPGPGGEEEHQVPSRHGLCAS